MNKIQQLIHQHGPVVMGILNTTPDSFSDGGLFVSPESACQQAMLMVDAGAQIIDVGGESTRPGATEVTIEDELQRVIPVIEAIRRSSDIAISIDTSKPQVMQAAIEAGADMVNDVNALQAEGALEICARYQLPVCLMHMQGQPRTMQKNPQYNDVVEDIKNFLQQRMNACIDAGIDAQNIILDPGFGFGKTVSQNYSLLKHLHEFFSLNQPLLIGVSRKNMLAEIIRQPPKQRVVATAAANVLALNKGAKIFRVHDVKENIEALKIAQAMLDAP